MQRRIDKTFLQKCSPNESKSTLKINDGPINEEAELEQINALNLLLKNRFSKTVCLLGRLLNSLHLNFETDFTIVSRHGLIDEAPKRSKLLLGFSHRIRDCSETWLVGST